MVQPQVQSLQASAWDPEDDEWITSLDQLYWREVDEPPPGYQHRTVVEVAQKPVELLLDTGAAFSFVHAEVVIDLLNQAKADGLTNTHPDWPLLDLCAWGKLSIASSASAGGKSNEKG